MSKVKIFGEHDPKTEHQIHEVAEQADRAALMADGHLGYYVPIGGVVAYDNMVSTAGVGVDISCGNAAIKTDMKEEELPNLNELADEIFNTFAFGPGGSNQEKDAPKNHELFEDDRWSLIPDKHVRDTLKAKARKQLGTIGGGNHYVDVFVDDDGYVWAGCHFGSRGFGYEVSSNFTSLSAGKPWGSKVRNHAGLVHLDNPIGHDYWHLMNLAGEYAYAGREWVVRKVLKILGANEVELVHNHHNHAWKESHFGKEYVVVRKGATPAWPGQKGFVGSTMAEPSVILEGVEHKEGSKEQWLQKQALFSTVHGAGRVLSRRKAKENIDKDEVLDWIEKQDVVVRGAGLDEAPQAYKRLDKVLEDQGPTVRILHKLYPRIVCMAPDKSLNL